MTDVRLAIYIIPDNGRDGLFWRAGVPWVREDGKERRVPLADREALVSGQARAFEERAAFRSVQP